MGVWTGDGGGGEGVLAEVGLGDPSTKGTGTTDCLEAGTWMVGKRRWKGVSLRAIGILQSARRWPERPQRRQRTGSRQSRTLWSVARQRKKEQASWAGGIVLEWQEEEGEQVKAQLAGRWGD